MTRETEGLSPSHYLTLAKAKCSRKSQVEHGWQAVQGEQIVHVVEREGESWQTVKIEQKEKGSSVGLYCNLQPVLRYLPTRVWWGWPTS